VIGDRSGSGKAADDDGWNETANQMSKVDEVESSLSEKPGHHRPRRLADWINPTGTRKVHSLIDKVYKRKNLEMAWEKVKANAGAGGVDGESIEARLRERVDQLHEDIKADRYRPLPVRQKLIPKEGQPDQYRKLGIPAVIRPRVSTGPG
jgi:RNA-directed DNA polymerase